MPKKATKKAEPTTKVEAEEPKAPDSARAYLASMAEANRARQQEARDAHQSVVDKKRAQLEAGGVPPDKWSV